MTTVAESDPSSADRVDDVEAALRALRQAVREALQAHKRAGNPVAVWRNGRVEWLEPEDIPDAESAGDG